MKQLIHETNKLFISTIQVTATVALIDSISGHNPDNFPYESMVFKKLADGDINYSDPLETKWYSTQEDAAQGHLSLVKKYQHHDK